MPATLFTLVVDDPEPVLAWLAEHAGSHMVRRQATRLGARWSLKIAIENSGPCVEFGKSWADSLVTIENHMKLIAARRARPPESAREMLGLFGRR